MCIIVRNPWIKPVITWQNTIADCDRAFFNANYGSLAAFVTKINGKNPNIGMTFDCLPEPFSGDMNSNVYCLNMNPGEPDPSFHNDKNFEKLTQDNLIHKLKSPMWTQNLKNSFGNIHAGYSWILSKTRELRIDKQLGQNPPNIFFIDFFPYHSKHGFSFPKNLPSDSYRDYLVRKAMEDEKIIIIMRQKKRWFNAIPGLAGYPRLITLKSPAGGWLSNSNFNYGPGVTYSDLLKAL